MLDSILQSIDSFIWGPPLLILLAGVGIYFTFQLRLIQLFRLPRALKYIFKSEDGENHKGDISAFEMVKIIKEIFQLLLP